jgi:hypothetical protein
MTMFSRVNCDIEVNEFFSCLFIIWTTKNQVGTWEIPAHRVILACCSPYLFELFSTDDGGKCSEENIITYKLNGGFEKDSFEQLINYAYTGK